MSNPNASSETKSEFSVRIVVCDHYLTRPIPGIDVIYSDFRGSDIKQVPVLRIFGSAPDGHKVCLHIHGVFPYFCVPCPVQNPQPQFLYQIAASLDKALNIALKQATSVNQHVYKISLVKGLPFYGFHDKDHLYLKVFLYNPGLIKHAVELCSNGALLGQTFQPHESHLSFTLQFFIDFNLFGMSNIDLQSVKFRKTGLSQNSNEPVESDEFTVKPESICYYEADCIASHIINRQRIGKTDGTENPGLEEVWNQETERRKQLNMSLALKSLTQGRIKAEETESHYKFEQMFLVKMSNLIDKSANVELELKKDLDKVYYPAESVEGSQFFNAVDVSFHLPNHGISICEPSKRILEEILTEDVNTTIVDEKVVLNSSLSLHYSQVMLNSEDLELVDMLQGMDEKHVEEDSVLGTPAEIENEANAESDDAEYSQVFDEDTILLNPNECKDDDDKDSLSWNDSFWDGVNIPQLDGTCDDDHVKKVRKRKMRSFKLGLSRPKVNKKDLSKSKNEESESKNDGSDTDEINASRETISTISGLYLKASVKTEVESNLGNSKSIINEDSVNKFEIRKETIVNLAKEERAKCDGVKLGVAESYDLEKQYEPIAGASRANNITSERFLIQNNSINISCESFPDDSKLGIMSFYDTSKIFDISLDDNKTQSLGNSLNIINDWQEVKQEPKTPNKEFNEVLDKKSQVDFKENLETKHNNIYKNVETSVVLTPKIRPPTKSYVVSSLENYKISKIKNPSPYFSDCKDVGDKIEIGQMVLKLRSKVAKDQKPHEKVLDNTSIEEWRQLLFLQRNEITEDSSKPEALKILLAGNVQYILEPVKKPPMRKDIIKWLQDKENDIQGSNNVAYTEITENIDEMDNSQAIGLNENEINNSISLESNDDKDKALVNSTIQVTMQPDGSFLCFGSSENKKECSMLSPTVEVDFLTLMLIEVLTSVRGELNPDPSTDPILAVFIKVVNDCPPDHFLTKSITEIIVVDSLTPPKLLDRCIFNENVTYVNNENEVLKKVIELVRKHDPDIMCGHEIEMNSWGYVIERSQVLGLEIVKELSRITDKNRQKRWKSEDNDFEGRIIGRITFNVWRLLRHELALSSYSFENTMYEVLKERVPTYSYAQLAEWWNDESRILRWIPVEYYMTKLMGTVRMLEKLDIIKRTSELARLFGMQWWEVLSRGSQYRVESLMLRAARPLNLVALSPTIKQRSTMRAPECLPLIFEPESRFYSDPVIVLDFQSLYPSMMIAYNYCFSTCIGRVQNINGESAYEFGAWRLRIPKCKLEALVKNGLVHWSPVGVGFVKSTVRRGVLPAMLRRILAARQAVKKSMKMQTDENVKKAMHSRQLGLKLIANVTYGYTAANYSGRMPCVEVADSVVSKGRETLERAIQLVNNSKQWNVKVVYGDTDSMFVQVAGGTRAEAFAIGQQIADAVTADNPSPVALKLEKVYQPCILQTKKRYVGYMYESPDQATPVYEAKGIETVRRDGCPAGVKLLQRSLCELFESGDMSRVKRSAMAVLSRLADGSLPVHELFFTREYHGPGGYKPAAVVPPNEIAKRIISRDRRAAPRTGERVRWLVCAGAAGPLARLARAPCELAADPAGPPPRPHVAYYATRVLLPPLHRCLSLLGVNVFKWWNEVGHSRSVYRSGQGASGGGIARYMWRERCAVCGARGARTVCAQCAARAQRTSATLAFMLHDAQAHVARCDMICGSCCGHAQCSRCENTECPVFWRRRSARHQLTQVRDVVLHLPPQFTKQSLHF